MDYANIKKHHVAMRYDHKQMAIITFVFGRLCSTVVMQWSDQHNNEASANKCHIAAGSNPSKRVIRHMFTYMRK